MVLALSNVRANKAGDKARIVSLSSLPTAIGSIARYACARVEEAGLKPEPLLAEAGLAPEQIKDRSARIDVRHQIRFLDLAARALKDELLGFHLARDCEFREFGLIYYIPASAPTLGEGLRQLSGYSSMINEGLSIQYHEGKNIRIILDVPGHPERHQIEFYLTLLTRLCRHLTRHPLRPTGLTISHRHDGAISKLAAFLDSDIQFNAKVNEIAFNAAVKDLPVVTADPYLNAILIAYCKTRRDII
jgi:hypothetical protein